MSKAIPAASATKNITDTGTTVPIDEETHRENKLRVSSAENHRRADHV